MESVITHINENWRFYGLLMFLLSCLALFWLTKYFVTKTELNSHKCQFNAHLEEFKHHKAEHLRLRDQVMKIDNHLSHLPTAKESQELREELALTRGRLEGLEPLLNQILNNQNMLLENELRSSNGSNS